VKLELSQYEQVWEARNARCSKDSKIEVRQMTCVAHFEETHGSVVSLLHMRPYIHAKHAQTKIKESRSEDLSNL